MPLGEDGKIRDRILGYAYMLKHELVTEFKRSYPRVVLPGDKVEERTERPTIDVSDQISRPGIAFNTNSGRGSFFRADSGFKPKGRKGMPYIGNDGRIHYKFE